MKVARIYSTPQLQNSSSIRREEKLQNNRKDVNFEGLFNKVSKDQQKYVSQHVASRIGKKFEEIYTLLNGKSEKRMAFFELLAKKYNSRNYYKPTDLKENPDTVVNIFKTLKDPHRSDFSLVSRFNGSFKELQTLLKDAKDDNAVKFVTSIQDIIEKSQDKRNSVIFEVLKSKHRAQYINNFDNYKYYFKLNIDNPNSVAELDKLVENGQYDSSLFKKNYDIKKFLKNFKNADNDTVFTKENLLNNYSRYGIELMKDISYSNFELNSLPKDLQKDILAILKTTTKENYFIRKSLLKELNYTYISKDKYNKLKLTDSKVGYGKNFNIEEGIRVLRNLYQRADYDKNAYNFILKNINETYNNVTLRDMEVVLSTISGKKASTFYENIQDIFLNTNDTKQRIEFLKKDLMKPFFETPEMTAKRQKLEKAGIRKKLSSFDKIKISMKNAVDVLKSTLSTNKEPQKLEPAIVELGYKKSKEETKLVRLHAKIQTPFLYAHHGLAVANGINNMPSAYSRTPVTIALGHLKDRIHPLMIFKPAGKINTRPEITELSHKLNLVKNFKNNKQASKYQLMKDVNDIIKKRLGIKTYETQQKDYENKATKIRLKLLPEIFDSIAQRRKTDRLNGKTKGLSSNKDALTLYNMIKGNNRKLVNYMLKIRNTEGARIFEVKDIIELLQRAQIELAQSKAQNPQMTAKDTKLYYDKIFDDMTHLYGKVKRTKSTNSKKKI